MKNMQSETKKCQNCHKEFTIEPDDFGFYEKIKVPPPTWCPDCRLIRRLQWRNEHSLFRRKNEANGEMIISAYHPEAKIKTYDRETWWGDSWDPRDYGRDYDFSRPFFEQFRELLQRVPHMALLDSRSVNARFCNVTVEIVLIASCAQIYVIKNIASRIFSIQKTNILKGKKN